MCRRMGSSRGHAHATGRTYARCPPTSTAVRRMCGPRPALSSASTRWDPDRSTHLGLFFQLQKWNKRIGCQMQRSTFHGWNRRRCKKKSTVGNMERNTSSLQMWRGRRWAPAAGRAPCPCRASVRPEPDRARSRRKGARCLPFPIKAGREGSWLYGIGVERSTHSLISWRPPTFARRLRRRLSFSLLTFSDTCSDTDK
jgi:hypothetical protein